jgi:hypothetical protein
MQEIINIAADSSSQGRSLLYFSTCSSCSICVSQPKNDIQNYTLAASLPRHFYKFNTWLSERTVCKIGLKRICSVFFIFFLNIVQSDA